MKTLLEWLMSFLLVVSIISNHDCNNNQHHCCCFQINAFIIKTNHRNYFHLKDKLGDTPLKKRRLAAVVGDNLGGHELSLSPPSNTKVGSSFLSSLSPQNSERDASSEKGKRSKIKIRSIINCKDQQELADHIRDNYDEIRHYHISFYWNAIANFAKPQQGQFQGKYQEQKLGQQITMFKPLLELTSDIFMKDSMVLQPKGLMLTIKSIARLNIWTGGIFASKNQRVWKIIETHILERKKKGFKKEEETASATMSWDTRDDDDDCELKVRDYVNIANTFANIRRRSDSLFKFIEHEILSSMESNQQNQEKNNMSLDPYHLSITVCAYVKSRYPAPKLFAAIASSAVCQIDAFQPKFLASMTYSFATCRHAAPEFFDAAAKVIILCNSGSGNNKRDSLNAQDIANTLWAYAKTGKSSPQLFDSMSQMMLDGSNDNNRNKLNFFNAQNIASTLWAYAKTRNSSPQLFDAMSQMMVSNDYRYKLKYFTTQEIANTLYAYAKTGNSSPELFDAMSQMMLGGNSNNIRSKLNSFNTQEIANTLWAYAKTGNSSPELFDAMSQMILSNNNRILNSFNTQDIANILWAYATVGNSSPELFDAMSQTMLNNNNSRSKLDSFYTQGIANTLWAYAKTGNSSPELFDAMSQMMLGGNSDNIRSRLNSFDTQNIANTLWAYAKTGNSSPELFDAMSQTILGGSSNNNKSKLDAFEAYGIADTLWAYALADHTNIDPKLVDALLYKVIPMIATIPSSSCYKFNSIILWSLAVLDCTNPNRAIPFFTEIARQYHNTTTTNNNNNGEELLLPGASASQLYQASLWYIGERQQESLLPNSLQREIQSLMKTDYRPQTISRLQREVGEVLEKEVKYLREEVICSQTGYSIDIVVQNDDNEGEEIAFEVDGPSHFNNNRSPTGSTVLKRRQLRNLGTRQLISIPYWEW
eukprot:CAMPEP_0194194592 /NCGR_PEP_ID=MMETSP0154-20130528/75668_1 /TAXON_ID=1049557 /ORGANISM="Thalassiothrix antarctica, Strain L6-D1" /LENGTH=930 /DNA_ID=CAMNT_0038919037 /DNA_START=70 /DNA_END=2859 /DNA_ORIENTATION=-